MRPSSSESWTDTTAAWSYSAAAWPLKTRRPAVWKAMKSPAMGTPPLLSGGSPVTSTSTHATTYSATRTSAYARRRRHVNTRPSRADQIDRRPLRPRDTVIGPVSGLLAAATPSPSSAQSQDCSLPRHLHRHRPSLRTARCRDPFTVIGPVSGLLAAATPSPSSAQSQDCSLPRHFHRHRPSLRTARCRDTFTVIGPVSGLLAAATLSPRSEERRVG